MSALQFHDRPAHMPIPDRLNLVLVAGVFSAAIFLLWLGSHVESWWATLGVGVVFSYLLLTNYALFHEAGHGNLHSNPTMNRLLGTLAGLIFPMPYSMFRVTHQGHHLRNRTDHEMFDLYYPSESRLIRCVQWYGVLTGMFWPWVPIGAVLFALCPAVLRTRLFRKARSSSYLLGDIRDLEVARSALRCCSPSPCSRCCFGCWTCAGRQCYSYTPASPSTGPRGNTSATLFPGAT